MCEKDLKVLTSRLNNEAKRFKELENLQAKKKSAAIEQEMEDLICVVLSDMYEYLTELAKITHYKAYNTASVNITEPTDAVNEALMNLIKKGSGTVWLTSLLKRYDPKKALFSTYLQSTFEPQFKTSLTVGTKRNIGNIGAQAQLSEEPLNNSNKLSRIGGEITIDSSIEDIIAVLKTDRHGRPIREKTVKNMKAANAMIKGRVEYDDAHVGAYQSNVLTEAEMLEDIAIAEKFLQELREKKIISELEKDIIIIHIKTIDDSKQGIKQIYDNKATNFSYAQLKNSDVLKNAVMKVFSCDEFAVFIEANKDLYPEIYRIYMNR